MTTMTLRAPQAALVSTGEATDGRPTQPAQERAGQAEYQHTATGTGLRTAKEADPAPLEGTHPTRWRTMGYLPLRPKT